MLESLCIQIAEFFTWNSACFFDEESLKVSYAKYHGCILMGITLDDAKLFSGGSLKKKPNVWVLSYFAHTLSLSLSLTCMQCKPIRTITMRSFHVKSCMSYLPPLCCRTFFRGVSSRDERNVPSFLTRLIVVKRYFSSADALRFLCWFFFR